MNFRAEKARVFQIMLDLGLAPEELPKALELGQVSVPQEMRDRWIKQMSTARLPEFESKRYVNKFYVGADPEFVFTNLGTYKSAEDCGFNTLQAFGCDMSGRQAEIRAYPSRSVVEVLASIRNTLLWMNARSLRARGFSWSAPAIMGRDGIGGHIHFGRKRPRRTHEIENLDIATRLLLGAGVLDAVGQEERKLGGYGKAGDVRLQPHGYEYRTPPTWLCSPEVAFLTLTVAKLCLFHKQYFLIAKKVFAQIRSLLAAYKAFDDDAAIAYAWLQRHPFPQYLASDFRNRWGLPLVANPLPKGELFFPEVIKAGPISKRVLFEYLTQDKPIPCRNDQELTWELFELPRGVKNVEVQPHVGGLPEVGSGLVSKGIKVGIVTGGKGWFQVSTPMPLNPEAIRAKMRETLPFKLNYQLCEGWDCLTLTLPPIADHYVPNRKLVAGFRELISNPQLFPICKGNKFYQVKWPEAYGVKTNTKLVGRRVV